MDDKEFHTVRGYQLIEQNKRALTPAMEDYLEMICRNNLQDGYIRINKLAELLNVKASSASKMVQKLGQVGLLKYEKYGIAILTDNGKRIGRYLLNRHDIIERFLKTIGITENLLVETELIEHNISSATLDNMSMLNRFFETNPSIAIMYEEFKASFSGDVIDCE
jgi:Mn-dependent DtxR family transcriptional regulator